MDKIFVIYACFCSRFLFYIISSLRELNASFAFNHYSLWVTICFGLRETISIWSLSEQLLPFILLKLYLPYQVEKQWYQVSACLNLPACLNPPCSCCYVHGFKSGYLLPITQFPAGLRDCLPSSIPFLDSAPQYLPEHHNRTSNCHQLLKTGARGVKTLWGSHHLSVSLIFKFHETSHIPFSFIVVKNF